MNRRPNSTPFGARRDRNGEAGGRGLSVGFVLLPEFTFMAFAGFVEVLRHASTGSDGTPAAPCSWTVLGPPSRPARASCGVEIACSRNYCEPSDFDYLVVVGGLLKGHAAVEPEIPAYLATASKGPTSLVGLCTGTFLLARAGLLAGRRCSVSHYHIDDFHAEFPDIRADAGSLFTVDRKVLTCAGGGASIDLALHIIEQEIDRSTAIRCASQMVIEGSRTSNHPQAHVDRDILDLSDDALIRKAFLYLVVNLSRSMTVHELADYLRVSVRQLERTFQSRQGQSPSDFIRRVRISEGKRLLTNTDRTITQIAYDCGFADASHFTRTFHSVFGTTPTSLRSTAAAERPS